ncbi:AB hydrolase-1 domain-containing protein [Haematococcus lacustris]|uniref:AB hydrolase-1 domain-containing protein n=1 Tax=Haematococcus lacustris TaxID=44745 RepID=A0A699Y6B4_HAELA|nr:AB hydrolase-1 domain-containing protein [Haematococcus lacustris]
MPFNTPSALLAYYDKATWATDDAWRVGRLNTFLPGWFEANVAFIQSGGYFMPEQRIQQATDLAVLCYTHSKATCVVIV